MKRTIGAWNVRLRTDKAAPLHTTLGMPSKKSDLWWVFIGEGIVYAMCVNCRYCHYCRFSNRQYRQKRQNRQYVSYLLRVHNGFLTGPTATMTLLCDNYDITMSFSSHCWWINSLPSRQSVLSLSITPNVIRVIPERKKYSAHSRVSRAFPPSV